MSDTARMYDELVKAGPAGVHTLDLRRQGISGNPSQRATDIEAKYGVEIHRERERQGDRNGSRYTLVEVSARGAAQDSPSMRKEALPIIASADLSEPTRLFTPPSLNPLTDAEAA